nr:PREDICTED: TBC1 domain family member 25 [Bemisia tabaci]
MAGYSYRGDAVRVKAVKFEDSKEVNSKKFCVDPAITTFEVLQSILMKAFEMRGGFTVQYSAKDDFGQETYLGLLSDWDLDAAFLNASEPYLYLRVEAKSENLDSEDWENVDVAEVATQALPAETWVPQRLPGMILNQVEKTFNIVKGAFNLAEEAASPVFSMQPPQPPLTDAEFRQFLDPVGQVVRSRELRSVIYFGGVEPSLRKVVWKHLLNVYPEGMSGKERMDYMKRKANEYFMLRDTWREMLKNGQMVGDLAYVTGMVRKDVLRTDRHHPFYAGSDDNQNIASLFNILTTYALNHPQVSYCQGMSDLASPLLVTMGDEAQAYICFCALMRRLSPNFLLDGITMTQRFQHLTDGLLHYDPAFYNYLKSHQADDLLFCYRWLLLEMKREFAFEDALQMLEVMWSSLPVAFPNEELKLFDKEFRLPSDLPPPSPRENAYTKVCALRRQTSASIPLSLHSVDDGSISRRRAAPFVKQTKKKQFLSMDDFSSTNNGSPPRSQQSSSCGDKNQYFPSPSKINLDFKNKLDLSKSKCKKLFSSLEISGKSDKTKSENAEQTTSGKVIKNLNEFMNFDRSNSLRDQSRTGLKKQNNVETCQRPDSDSSNTDSSPDDFPVETVVRDIKNEAENLDKSVLAMYESHYSSSTDSEDEVSKSPSKSDVFVWENPICRTSSDCLDSDRSYSDLNAATYEKNIQISDKNFQGTWGPPQNEKPVSSSIQISMNGISNAWADAESAKMSKKLSGLPAPQEFGGGNPFLMFLCITILCQHRDRIMRANMDYNEVAMHFDKMVRKHNVTKVLNQARTMYEAYLKQFKTQDLGNSLNC